MISVSHLYDSLSYFVQAPNWLAYRDRYAGLTMHKALAADKSAPAMAGVSAVNQLLLEQVPFPKNGKFLDAGCGFGGTAFFLQEHFGGKVHGITLSRVQAKVAQREARRRRLENCMRFSVRSYDEPLNETFDGIVTIESLSHSPNLRQTVENLATALVPGGWFVMIEDTATVDLEAMFPEESALLKEHWGCVALPQKVDFQNIFSSLGFAMEKCIDLSSRVRHRDLKVIDLLISKYQRRLGWVPFSYPRAIVSAYLGGLALEKLYAKGAAAYWMLVFRRKSAKVSP